MPLSTSQIGSCVFHFRYCTVSTVQSECQLNPVGGILRRKIVTVMMRAARLHAVNEPMRIEEVAKPRASGTDVVVEVKACGMVPNLCTRANGAGSLCLNRCPFTA